MSSSGHPICLPLHYLTFTTLAPCQPPSRCPPLLHCPFSTLPLFQAHLFHYRIGVATRRPNPALRGVTMTLKKLAAGSGYEYLTRQVAAADSTELGRTRLVDY